MKEAGPQGQTWGWLPCWPPEATLSAWHLASHQTLGGEGISSHALATSPDPMTAHTHVTPRVQAHSDLSMVQSFVCLPEEVR